ncbi:hypothetical protein [Corynebacterium sp. A21]|uniref:hypothetical protein n=1 Tax=Corynebacterium sp. A21 TaxID=3457318 RepID=UPI003FD2B216
MSGIKVMSDPGIFTASYSRRSLISSRFVLGSGLSASLVLFLGMVLAGSLTTGVSMVVALLVPVLISLGILWGAEYWVKVRMRPHFSLAGHYFRDFTGQEFDLTDFIGIQSWVDSGGEGTSSAVNFTLIPRGAEARVDPKAKLAAAFSRNHRIPRELESFTFRYPNQLRPPLHIFTAELQRRAPHLFLDHVGEI